MRDIARSGKQLVHVGHTLNIDRRFDELSPILVRAPREWFPSRVGIHIAGIPVRKRVVVVFGDAVKTSNWAAVGVSWKATFPEKLFPTMQGKVSLSPVGRETTKLTVSGVYSPPLGRFGEELNEALMHGIAELTVKELAESVAQRLRRRAA